MRYVFVIAVIAACGFLIGQAIAGVITVVIH